MFWTQGISTHPIRHEDAHVFVLLWDHRYEDVSVLMLTLNPKHRCAKHIIVALSAPCVGKLQMLRFQANRRLLLDAALCYALISNRWSVLFVQVY